MIAWYSPRAQFAAQRQPVAIGQVEIEHHHCAGCRQRRLRLGHAAGGLHGKALALKLRDDQFADVRVVVHHKDAAAGAGGKVHGAKV
jgi:hypothetical protein